MKSRKTKVFIKEFWSNYSSIMAATLALSPFLLIISARGFFLPLALTFLFLIVSAIVCILYAFNTSTITIDNENKEIMQALRGTK